MPVLEEWLVIPDLIGYEVSNLGRVRTYRSANGRGGLKEHPRLMKNHPTPQKPYLRVRLAAVTGGDKYWPVHQLVLLAFRGPRPTAAHDSCHDDGNAQNNVLTNLRWDTKQANADDRVNHGTQIRGVQVSLAVLTEEQVKEIKAAIPIWKKGLGRYFATKFGVGNSAISAIKHGLTWKHV